MKRNILNEYLLNVGPIEAKTPAASEFAIVHMCEAIPDSVKMYRGHRNRVTDPPT